MKTRDEIIHQYSENSGYDGGYSESDVEKMLDEYAKESSLDFAKWLNDNCIVATGGQWRHHKKWIPIKNTDELYEMYQQEKSSLK